MARLTIALVAALSRRWAAARGSSAKPRIRRCRASESRPALDRSLVADASISDLRCACRAPTRTRRGRSRVAIRATPCSSGAFRQPLGQWSVDIGAAPMTIAACSASRGAGRAHLHHGCRGGGRRLRYVIRGPDLAHRPETPEDEDDDLFGGGVARRWRPALRDHPLRPVFCLDAATGEVDLAGPVPSPMRTGRPSATAASSCSPSTTSCRPGGGGRRPLWSYQGISEAAGLLGAAPPRWRNTVIVGFSSGRAVRVARRNRPRAVERKPAGCSAATPSPPWSTFADGRSSTASW